MTKSLEQMAEEWISEGDKPMRLYDSCCSWFGSDHRGWSTTQMQSALKEGYLAGAKAALELAALECEGFGKHYPEDIFTPLPEYGTPEQEAQDNVLVTRASAQMGRHMSKLLAQDIRTLVESEDATPG